MSCSYLFKHKVVMQFVLLQTDLAKARSFLKEVVSSVAEFVEIIEEEPSAIVTAPVMRSLTAEDEKDAVCLLNLTSRTGRL